MGLHLALALAAAVAAMAAAGAGEETEKANGFVTVRAVPGADGHVGFDVYAKGRLVCPIRLSSEGSVVATKVEKGEGWIEFRRLRLAGCRAVRFSRRSFVRVSLTEADPFPRVSFRLRILRFDKAAWEKKFGKVPFHFLCCYQPDAEIFHQQGWNIPTPKLEPYVLQHGRQGIVASRWSRDWSYAPPMGALTTPVVGLWAPAHKRFVAYDFTEARLTDHSDKYVASAYCWKKGADGRFVCLVYPHAKMYVSLRYPPSEGATVESHFSLIYDLDMPAWGDPAVFYHATLWERFASLLPASPLVNDLSWIAGSRQLKDFPCPGYWVRLYTDYKKGGSYVDPGTICPWGWGIPYLQSIDYAYLTKQADDIARLKKEIEFCLPYAKRFEARGEQCVYWEKPLEGSWKKGYGAKHATSLYNVNGWAIAKAMLDIWRHEKVEGYLPHVEGTLNWTRQMLFTRNGYADVPEAMFTLGEMGIAFCLDYYATFKDDPAKGDRAKGALELARMLAYRYNVIYPADNDEADNLDATFLVQPNSGQPWVGAACSNECDELMYVLAEVYVATGDPILRHYLLGMLERWPVMYKEMYASSIKDYPDNATTENYGLFDDCPQPRGTRATYGGMTNILPMLIFPVGDSKARVGTIQLARVPPSPNSPAPTSPAEADEGLSHCLAIQQSLKERSA